LSNHSVSTSFSDQIGILAAKLALTLSPRSTSAPGLAALKISPGLLACLLNKLAKPPILITGTNGKSTTAGFLANILKAEDSRCHNWSFIHNRSGANLPSGLVTSLVQHADLQGHLDKENALLEVDEAVLRKVTSIRPARLILATNFFRDQLDRFGEMEQTIKLVQEGIRLVENGSLIINADDPNTCHLKLPIQESSTNKNSTFKESSGQLIYYGISPEIWGQSSSPKIFAEELASCPACGEDLAYRKQWLGQLGDFFCSACNYQKPPPSIKITELNLSPLKSNICVSLPNNLELKVQIPLPGLFNVYNALAAIASAYSLGISMESIKEGIENYQSLFGRSQSVNYNHKELRLFLIKNPIGASEVLRLISSDPKAKVLIAINDNYADGRDVSWLWDAYFEYLAELNQPVFVSGSRSSDIAVRLKYAGIKQIHYYHSLKDAIDEFTSIENSNPSNLKKDSSHNLYVLPTYTALLELTKIMKLSKS
jgi:UDP-N-acetylmuramyl tripeptide synthase